MIQRHSPTSPFSVFYTSVLGRGRATSLTAIPCKSNLLFYSVFCLYSEIWISKFQVKVLTGMPPEVGIPTWEVWENSKSSMGGTHINKVIVLFYFTHFKSDISTVIIKKGTSTVLFHYFIDFFHFILYQWTWSKSFLKDPQLVHSLVKFIFCLSKWNAVNPSALCPVPLIHFLAHALLHCNWTMRSLSVIICFSFNLKSFYYLIPSTKLSFVLMQFMPVFMFLFQMFWCFCCVKLFELPLFLKCAM